MDRRGYKAGVDMDIDEKRIKELFKEAIVEFIEERKDILCELFAEVIEDIALANAIREGESSGPVSRRDIFKLMEGMT